MSAVPVWTVVVVFKSMYDHNKSDQEQGKKDRDD